MPNLNSVMLIGNITRDIETRYTPKGTAVAKIGLAINRQWTTDSGEKKEDVCFVDVEAFGKQAEVLAQYCKKGDPLFVSGRLKLDSWEDKQTQQKRSKLGVVLESFQFLGGKKDGERSTKPESKPQSKIDDADVPAKEDDDSVPF